MAWRLVLALGALSVAVWRGTYAVHWYRQWQEWRVTDPSGAELYHINSWFESAWAVLAFGVALVFGWQVWRKVTRHAE